MNKSSKPRNDAWRSIRLPAPSLEIGLLRPDPWNEFVIGRPISVKELVEFNSLRDGDYSRLNARISESLTTVLAPPMPPEPVVDPPSGDLVPVISSSLKPVAIGGPTGDIVPLPPTADATPISEPTTGASLWDRVTGIVDTLRHTSFNALPDWFANETSLVPPTDPEIRARLCSIYGGDLTQVQVTVRVIEAIDVPVADWWGTSDPYVCACIVRGVGGISSGRLELLPTIGNQKFSSTKFGSLNPKWNESVVLDLADLLTVISDSVLYLSLWDKDMLKPDNPFGYSTLSLTDVMQTCGLSPFPLIPIQLVGSLVGPHAGLFVKIHLRMVKKVGIVSVTPIALQGFSNGWKNYSIRVEAKVVESDPIASGSYMSTGVCLPETSAPAKVNETGHAIWPKEYPAMSLLFSVPKKSTSNPFLHLTLKSDGSGIGADPGQIAVRIGMLEKFSGVSPIKLHAMAGSPPADQLSKCSLYCGVECDAVK